MKDFLSDGLYFSFLTESPQPPQRCWELTKDIYSYFEIVQVNFLRLSLFIDSTASLLKGHNLDKFVINDMYKMFRTFYVTLLEIISN